MVEQGMIRFAKESVPLPMATRNGGEVTLALGTGLDLAEKSAES
jgi:hypothetical protein